MYYYNIKNKKEEYSLLVIESVFELELDEILNSRFNYYLRLYKNKDKSNCASFLYYMINGEYPNKKIKSWKPIYSNVPTNYFLLLDDGNEKENLKLNYHFALYLPENGKYLSQFGNGGSIVLTNLKNMQSFFETKKIRYISNLQPTY